MYLLIDFIDVTAS